MSSRKMKNFFKGVNRCEITSCVMFAESGTKKFFCDMFKIGSNTRGSPFFWLPVALNCWESLVYRARYKVVDIVYTLDMKTPEVRQPNLQNEHQNGEEVTAKKKVSDFRNFDSEKQRELARRSNEAQRLRKAERELDAKITEYFSTHTIPTQTGLALALGFGSRQQLITESQNEANPLHNILANAFSRLDEFLETQLVTSKNQVGVIFALKNRGWTDTQTLRAETKAEVSIAVDTALEEAIKLISDKEINGTGRA